MPENFMERVRKVVGPMVLPDLTELDLGNDLHVDRAAAALIQRFKEVDDLEAYQLLIDLVADRLASIADDIARAMGLAEPSDSLVVSFFETLFVDLRPAVDEASAFLGDAAKSMRVDAEVTIRDIALSSISDPEGAVLWDADGLVPRATEDVLRARATRICFHRLDLSHRRVLRAKQVEDLSTAQIASEMSLPLAEVETLLHEAEDRLENAIDRELKGGSR